MTKKTKQLNIMVTGANGTIGCDLVYHLSKVHKVFAFYRTENFFSNTFKSDNLIWIKQDLKTKISYNIKPDIVIHGVVTHPFAQKQSNIDYIDSNIISLLNVIDFANINNVKTFIYLSSVKIYGEINTSILNDNNHFNSPDLLGATKILSETLLQNQNFKYFNIRLPGVLCYRNSPNERPWLNSIIKKLKSEKNIIVNNEKLKFNNIIDTIEIFNLINYLLSNKITPNVSFNFSASEPLNIREMILYIKDFFHSSSRITFQNNNSPHFIIDLDILKNYIRYKVNTTNTILGRYLNHVKSKTS